MKEFINKYKHSWAFLYALIYIPWFKYLETNVTNNYNIIYTDIDSKIPFCEYFIIPYLLWFGYVAITLLFLFFTNVEDFYKMCIFVFTGMTLFLIISTIYPNGHNLRPTLFLETNFCTELVQKLYTIDTSTNIFPSIHVYNSIATHLAIIKSDKLKENKYITSILLILMILIVLSTMFLKQHSFLDVISAIILSIAMYFIVYKNKYQRYIYKKKNQ